MKKKKTEENSNYNVELVYIDGKTTSKQMDKDALSRWLPYIAECLIHRTLDPNALLPPVVMVAQFLPKEGKRNSNWSLFDNDLEKAIFNFNGYKYVWNKQNPGKSGWYSGKTAL